MRESITKMKVNEVNISFLLKTKMQKKLLALDSNFTIKQETPNWSTVVLPHNTDELPKSCTHLDIRPISSTNCFETTTLKSSSERQPWGPKPQGLSQEHGKLTASRISSETRHATGRFPSQVSGCDSSSTLQVYLDLELGCFPWWHTPGTHGITRPYGAVNITCLKRS